ncbi:MAG: PilZ domain-containing protein [Pseudomonadota bacterium]
MIKPVPLKIEDRKAQRKLVDLPATINGNEARAVDVSEDGVQLKARTYLEPGAVISVDLFVPEIISFKGIVRHVNEKSLGVQTVEISTIDRLRLRQISV